jgi:hypothetical protein
MKFSLDKNEGWPPFLNEEGGHSHALPRHLDVVFSQIVVNLLDRVDSLEKRVSLLTKRLNQIEKEKKNVQEKSE